MKKIVLALCSHKKAQPYLDALKAVGVDGERVLVVTPEDPDASDGRALARLAREAIGLILGSGPDLEPHRYGEEPLENANLELVPNLDRLDWSLLEGARAAKTPVWAICRGLQVANVFLGGTLWQDLPSQLPETGEHSIDRPKDHLAHEIEVSDRTTTLGALLARESARVNSRHHQAIKDLAPELRAIAHAPDGVLEVAESRNGWWIQGVQWHPENLFEMPLQRELWQGFADATVGAGDGK